MRWLDNPPRASDAANSLHFISQRNCTTSLGQLSPQLAKIVWCQIGHGATLAKRRHYVITSVVITTEGARDNLAVVSKLFFVGEELVAQIGNGQLVVLLSAGFLSGQQVVLLLAPLLHRRWPWCR